MEALPRRSRITKKWDAPICADTSMSPRETTLADKPERVGEILQRDIQPLDSDHQFVRRHAAHPGLNGRNGLSVPEAEQPREIILRKLSLRAQCFDPRTDKPRRHRNFLDNFLAN